jgi:hypothetical protein
MSQQKTYMNMTEALLDFARHGNSIEVRLKDGTVHIGTISVTEGSSIVDVSSHRAETVSVAIDAIATIRKLPRDRST